MDICVAVRNPHSVLQAIEAASIELEAAVDAQSQAKREKDERIRKLEAQLEAARCGILQQGCMIALPGPCAAPAAQCRTWPPGFLLVSAAVACPGSWAHTVVAFLMRMLNVCAPHG